MTRRPISRRTFLEASLASAAALAGPSTRLLGQAPAIVPSEQMRPAVPSGLQIGDVLSDRALIWSRTDRPARLVVERALRADFGGSVRVRGPLALDTTDYTARLDLTELPPDRDVFVRVTFEDPSSGRTISAPVEGRLRTAPITRRDVRFLWSGDTAGQGFGINPGWGGMKIYEAMRRARPDFFIHSGDTIYADVPIPPAIRLADGVVWRNLVTEETSKVAETLREYRGRYAYNLMDENVRRFSAEVPQLWQWDDHEVLNNWSASTDLSRDPRYTEKRVEVLAARAKRAFLDYAPMRYHGPDEADRVYRTIPYGPLVEVFLLDARSYRGPNSHNRQARPGPDTAFLGPTQLAWLKDRLSQSAALWKVVACDMPIGLVVDDGEDADGRKRFDAVANGDGPAVGRELEFADLFRFIKQQRVRNIIWITADVHYTAAHFYDPQRAVFNDFEPFWEFVSGPLNAGTFGPNLLDNTFGPAVVFQKVPPTGGAAPTAGLQFFGQVDINGKTGAMTVSLKDLTGATLFMKTLEPIGT